MREGYVKYILWRRIANTLENMATKIKCRKMILTVRRVCCGVIFRGMFCSGGGIGKMDGLCVWVEM